MKIIFTKNRSILSVLIRFFTGEDCSHLAVSFDDRLVIQSNLLGVGMVYYPHFIKKSVIVHEISINVSSAREDKIWIELMDLIGEGSYDCRGLILDAVYLILGRMGIKINTAVRKNDNKYLCYEIANVLQERLNIDLGLDASDKSVATPHRVFEKMKRKFK